MLGYVSLVIGLCTIAVTLVFVITWLNLHDEIRNSSSLQEEFHSTVRRMTINIGIFAIPIVVYFFDAGKQSLSNADPYAFVWAACYAVSLLFLAAGVTILIRDAKREKKTGLYRFRRSTRVF